MPDYGGPAPYLKSRVSHLMDVVHPKYRPSRAFSHVPHDDDLRSVLIPPHGAC